MDIRVELGAIQEVTSELIVVNLFEGVTGPGGATGAVDRALGGAISALIKTGDFTGKAEQVAVLYTRGAIPAKRVLVVGLGEHAKFSAEVVRRAAAAAAKAARKLRVTRYHSIIHGAGSGGLDMADAAQAAVEGTILGSYAFTQHKSDLSDEQPKLEALTLLQADAASLGAARQGATAGQTIAEAACMTRDLANQPSNYLTPTLLAEAAEEMAGKLGLRYEVLEESQMAELGMGALLGVAQGSDEPAKFIVLEYNAERSDLEPYVVVGKGITFDSGGISIKPSEGMGEMKGDMSGAGTVLGVLRAVAALKLPLRVVGLMPATENLPSGHAYKPGDVLKSMSGLTIEVISTDAEGRLILADALDYAKRYHPKAVVDLATLTGACVIALGHVTTGLMSNNPELVRALTKAADKTGEKLWELPLYDEYAEQIKSDVADVKNSGGRPAGTITAGLFLSKFAKGYPWAHLDIAGTSSAEADKGYLVKGATGWGVRLLVQWLRDAASGASL
jgi:leucyl aminopeptidase